MSRGGHRGTITAMRAAAIVSLIAALLCTTVSAQAPLPVVQLVTPPPFGEWLAALRAEAEGRGLPAELLDRTLSGIQPVEQILERDRTQAEFTLDLEQYLKRRLTRDTVRTAQQMYTKHRRVLAAIEKQYGVPARVLVSVWGLESNFGRFAGVRPTIPTLVTLAYDPRRGPMFRNELFSALEIINRGDIELEHLKGSWAGALGQPQFMPSSYLQYAQDFDGDGRKDIWTSTADVFASVANFLHQHGWTRGARWGREVKIPKTLNDSARAIPRREQGCRATRLMTDPRPLSEWRKFGLLTATGTAVPKADLTASLVVAGTRSFLVYDNYDALLGYNCAHSYTLAVGLLSDLIK
jgi:membrane-bound lytic murein transglycosylase B